MIEDALAELDRLPVSDQNHPLALETRISVLIEARRWPEALEYSEILSHADSERALAGYFHRAFCLHELGRTKEARQCLESAPASLKERPVYHYNLACYCAVLGDLESALDSLRRCFKMEPKFRMLARQDDDLQTLQDRLP